MYFWRNAAYPDYKAAEGTLQANSQSEKNNFKKLRHDMVMLYFILVENTTRSNTHTAYIIVYNCYCNRADIIVYYS